MSWRYKKLGDLCLIEKGVTGIQKAIPGEYPMVVTSEERKSHNEFQFDDEAVIIPLVSSTGHGHKSLKRIHFQTGKFAVGSILCAVIPKDKTVLNAEYLYRYLDLKREDELVSRMKGMANVSLPIKEIAQIEIPLPSIEEQRKFVAEYGELESNKDELSTELTYQQDLLKQLRQAFLREAMQGRLVPNVLDVPTASELLKKIKAEKAAGNLRTKGTNGTGGRIAKTKNDLPPIKEEEIPFAIPESWVWCRLGEIINDTEGGKSPRCLHEPAKADEWGVLRTTAVQELFFLENENKVLPKNYKVSEQHKVLEGDVLITRAGPKNRVGIVCCVENLTKNLILSDKTIRIKHSKELINSKFIAIALNSPLIKPFIETKMVGMADSQVNISQDSMKGFPIPLPPLAEQNRIVKKLEEVMNLCEELKTTITDNQNYTNQLLQVALKDALQMKVVEVEN